MVWFGLARMRVAVTPFAIISGVRTVELSTHTSSDAKVAPNGASARNWSSHAQKCSGGMKVSDCGGGGRGVASGRCAGRCANPMPGCWYG